MTSPAIVREALERLSSSFNGGWAGMYRDRAAVIAEVESIARAALAALDATPGEGEAKVARLIAAASALLAGMSGTYTARNGRQLGIEADDGEKCWIIHSDLTTELEASLHAVEPIPDGIYYNAEAGNFYSMDTRFGMGNAFFGKWHDRRSEFPAAPLSGSVVK